MTRTRIIALIILLLISTVGGFRFGPSPDLTKLPDPYYDREFVFFQTLSGETRVLEYAIIEHKAYWPMVWRDRVFWKEERFVDEVPPGAATEKPDIPSMDIDENGNVIL